MKNSPMQSSQGERRLRSQSTVLNEQLTLLYQLEQRKTAKLEEENRALRDRIRNLLSKEDDDRIQLLVADKTRRKLVQLKAITERTIKSLESGLKEFRSFVDDIDEEVHEQELDGALEPGKATSTPSSSERILQDYRPRLKRIPESPMLPTTSCSSSTRFNQLNKINETFDENEEDETVEETNVDMLEEVLEKQEENEEQPNMEQANAADKIDVEKEKPEMDKSLLGPAESNEHDEQQEQHGEEDGTIGENYMTADDMSHVDMTPTPEQHNQNNNNADDDKSNDGEANDENSSSTLKGSASTGENDVNVHDQFEQACHIAIGNKLGASVERPTLSAITFRRTTRPRQTETPNQAGQDDQEHQQLHDSSVLTQFSTTSTQFSTPQSVNASTGSAGRQKRAAASKVQTYKLPPLNKKMRREH